MTNGEIIEQLENTIGLIKQDGKDWLDDRDIPILESCIKALTVLDKIRTEINRKAVYYEAEVNTNIASGMYKAIDIIDRYKKGANE